jgi:transcriptional regulator with XRE-family HTH domain
MLSSTLSEELGKYRIGEKLHELRSRKNLGLVELGRHTSLSPALLSKIERNRLYPTLPTLMRIAMVFGVGMDHFFSEDPSRPLLAITRARERLRFPDAPEAKQPAYFFECLDYAATDRKFNSYFAEFHTSKAGQVRRHQHAGMELLYVIRGKLGLVIGGQEHVLEACDSVYFDAAVSHGYRRIGSRACSGLVVTQA